MGIQVIACTNFFRSFLARLVKGFFKLLLMFNDRPDRIPP
jgi:hypothetical protein